MHTLCRFLAVFDIHAELMTLLMFRICLMVVNYSSSRWPSTLQVKGHPGYSLLKLLEHEADCNLLQMEWITPRRIMSLEQKSCHLIYRWCDSASRRNVTPMKHLRKRRPKAKIPACWSLLGPKWRLKGCGSELRGPTQF